MIAPCKINRTTYIYPFIQLLSSCDTSRLSLLLSTIAAVLIRYLNGRRNRIDLPHSFAVAPARGIAGFPFRGAVPLPPYAALNIRPPGLARLAQLSASLPSLPSFPLVASLTDCDDGLATTSGIGDDGGRGAATGTAALCFLESSCLF